ncbi:group II intron reverse transcriptase/maturase [Bacillus shivajii]|uniref:group II intron reverse transcriptase/maturase n=1 Tax=Bacillus shivajii TaxID=1983719 RepID=UPI001CFA8024|nr:group II intron reverse transcriptase/maturase [Bacillus shivajii]UCZ51843.1 group II intron reverse transcriptase/maturase [Bacillus shivajii]UCZ53446.1 group II intron reverse transcriptase/maturase [Bacillus shivajii]UCZ53948.1 group II intron reverse transcriptase/maturase [Bacillus shivajii]UCZ54545.1 group II intron reverse transcriptase/maturase [Bacillus shivajii]
METKLMRIAEVAKTNPELKFTSLIHLLNKDSLKECHHQLNGNKAPGILGTTKQEYSENLEGNLQYLINRMKKQSYKPQPVKRVYIDKSGSKKKRPLGIPEYEDKIIQKGLAKILNSIYEQDFLDCSFGFRPNRNCHDALKVLNMYIERRYTNYIVDVDIKGFFDNVDHKWMVEFLKHRINDPNVLRLINRFLKAGYVKDMKWYKDEFGTPQGGLASPILANVYLHYVLDLWFEKHVKKRCKGQAYIVRYADDFVCCFQYHKDAQQFYRALKERLKKFNLEIAEDKTKVIPFGRFAKENEQRTGNHKPPTFKFLGFTHYCSESKQGKFRVKRKTDKKKMRTKLKETKEWLKSKRNLKIQAIMDRLQRSLKGYYNYYCITDNLPTVEEFVYHIRLLLFKWMNRRSQRKSFTWDKFNLFMNKFPLPSPRKKVDIYNLRSHISYIQ